MGGVAPHRFRVPAPVQRLAPVAVALPARIPLIGRIAETEEHTRVGPVGRVEVRHCTGGRPQPVCLAESAGNRPAIQAAQDRVVAGVDGDCVADGQNATIESDAVLNPDVGNVTVNQGDTQLIIFVGDNEVFVPGIADRDHRQRSDHVHDTGGIQVRAAHGDAKSCGERPVRNGIDASATLGVAESENLADHIAAVMIDDADPAPTDADLHQRGYCAAGQGELRGTLVTVDKHVACQFATRHFSPGISDQGEPIQSDPTAFDPHEAAAANCVANGQLISRYNAIHNRELAVAHIAYDDIAGHIQRAVRDDVVPFVP